MLRSFRLRGFILRIIASVLAALFASVLNQPLTPLGAEPPLPCEPPPKTLPSGALERFGNVLSARTVASDPHGGTPELEKCMHTLRSQYASVFDTADLDESIAQHSALLLFSPLSGSNTCYTHAHFHYDVVPATDDVSLWSGVGPFSGQVVNNSIVGRGTFDAKGGLVAFLEALSVDIDRLKQRSTGLLVTISHDEESKGGVGTAALVERVEQLGVCVDFLLDEGGLVATDGLPPLLKPERNQTVAFVGIAEKGHASTIARFASAAGHSSNPTTSGACQQAASYVMRVSKEQPSPSLPEGVRMLLQQATIHSNRLHARAKQLVVSALNKRSVQAGVAKLLSRQGGPAGATVRTTASVVSSFSPEDPGNKRGNVNPSTAQVEVNLRLGLGSTSGAALEHCRRKSGDAASVSLLGDTVSEPVGESSANTSAFAMVAHAVGHAYGDKGAVTVPSVTTGVTDSRRFARLAKKIYRFYPLECDLATLCGAHDSGEKVGVESFGRAVVFYRALIRQL